MSCDVVLCSACLRTNSTTNSTTTESSREMTVKVGRGQSFRLMMTTQCTQSTQSTLKVIMPRPHPQHPNFHPSPQRMAVALPCFSLLHRASLPITGLTGTHERNPCHTTGVTHPVNVTLHATQNEKPSHSRESRTHLRGGRKMLHRLVFTIGLSSSLALDLCSQLNTISVAPRLRAACTAKAPCPHAPPTSTQDFERSFNFAFRRTPPILQDCTFRLLHMVDAALSTSEMHPAGVTASSALAQCRSISLRFSPPRLGLALPSPSYYWYST